MVSQHLHVLPQLSVATNVNMGMLGRWSVWKSLWALVARVNRTAVARHLDRLGVGHLVDRRADQCSGGERQRIAIARALIQDPELLCTDEPTAHLDPERSAHILSLVGRIAREDGVTWICAIHDVALVRAHFDRVIALHGGRVVWDRPVTSCSDEDLWAVYQPNTVAEN